MKCKYCKKDCRKIKRSYEEKFTLDCLGSGWYSVNYGKGCALYRPGDNMEYAKARAKQEHELTK